ncbi:MAG: Rieske 2Fe-2S domain-containing protein [Pirellulales bacterium]
MDMPTGAHRAAPDEPESLGRRRRSFLAIVFGSVLGLVPLVTGVLVFLDPLRRKTEGRFLRIATLAAVPDDGVPRPFPVIDDHSDAWSRTPNQPVGLIYLVREPGETVPTAFSATCPHAGCYIGFVAPEKLFRCPCHTSSFQLDGKRVGGASSVAPRGMDTLELRLEEAASPEAQVVLVQYQRFQTGKHEKIAVS